MFPARRSQSLTSEGYTEDFIETRDFGRADSTVRTAEQTDIAYFWSEHAYTQWNRNLINLAISYGLNVRETADFCPGAYRVRRCPDRRVQCKVLLSFLETQNRDSTR